MRYHKPTEIDRRHYIEDASTMVAVLDGRLSPEELSSYGSAMAATFDLLAALKKLLARENKRYAATDAGREHFARNNAEAIAAVAKAEGQA